MCSMRVKFVEVFIIQSQKLNNANAIGIMKSIKNLRKVISLNMVFGGLAYIGLTASCFFEAYFHVSPSHGMPLSLISIH